MVQYGGFWWRVLAYFIDYIILNVVSGLIGMMLGVGIGMQTVIMGGSSEFATGASALLGGLVGFVISWLYFAVLESSSKQASVGKMAVGLVVTDERGNRISFGRATGRYFAKILSAMILLIGFIMVAFTQRKQGLHDMIASTLVWKARDPRLVRDDEGIFA